MIDESIKPTKIIETYIGKQKFTIYLCAVPRPNDKDPIAEFAKVFGLVKK